MNNQNTKPQENAAADAVEDLTVNQDQAAEVVGGAHVDYFLRLRGIDGDISS